MPGLHALLALLVLLALTGGATHLAAEPLHLEIYGAKSRADIDLLRDAGFDQLALYDEGLIAYADAAGLRIVWENWWQRDTDPATIDQVVTRASQLDHLVSVNYIDEPIMLRRDHEPGYYDPAIYQAIRTRYDGLVPFSFTEYGPRSSWDKDDWALFQRYVAVADHVRLTSFPVAAGAPSSSVTDRIVAARRVMADMVNAGVIARELPITVVLQTWSSAGPDAPTPVLPRVQALAEMICLALDAGATTISFFDYNPVVWEQFEAGYTARLFALVDVHRRGEADCQAAKDALHPSEISP